MTCWQQPALDASCRSGIWGAVVAFLFVLALQTFLVGLARRHNPSLKFFDLIVTGDDRRYSLSRLQIYVWTVVVIVAFGATSFAHWTFADIPGQLLILMGVNVASGVAATAINTAKAGAVPPTTGATTVATAPAGPHFFRDIFLESGNAAAGLDLPRTQMFVWTTITVITYAAFFVKAFPAFGSTLPDIPPGMVLLMGISNGAYLGVKAAKT